MLDELLADTRERIAGLTTSLENGMRIGTWQALMERVLMRAHLAAFLIGADITTLDVAAESFLIQRLTDEFQFLQDWVVEIQNDDTFRAGWHSRGQLYGEKVKASYWTGATRALPLPYMPGDGTTQCITNCRCSWDIEQVGERDYNCRWVLGATDNNCQTCQARARRVIRIRDGVVEV